MCIVMGADTALNAQPAASPGRYLQCLASFKFVVSSLVLFSLIIVTG